LYYSNFIFIVVIHYKYETVISNLPFYFLYFEGVVMATEAVLEEHQDEVPEVAQGLLWSSPQTSDWQGRLDHAGDGLL
jgi:hypothetical protein